MTQLKSLDALRRVLENPDGIRRAVARNLGEEAINLVKDGFRTETDPYGDRWAPRKHETKWTRGRKVLSGRTSRLKGGWHLKQVSADQITVAPSVDYAAPHQDPQIGANGALKRPRRMMVPDSKLGLPPRWSKALNEAANDTLAVIFGADGRRVSGLRKTLGVDAFVGFKVG